MIKVIPAVILLLYSCIEDIKKREVEDWVWGIMIAAGLIFGLYEYFHGVTHDPIARNITVLKVLGLFFLVYGAILLLDRDDFRENVEDTPYIVGFLGLSIVMFYYAPNPFNVIFQHMSVTFCFVYFIAFFGMMGGGDAKALVAISSLFFRTKHSLPIFSISVFNNSLILVVFLPLVVCAYNLLKRNRFEHIEGQRLAKLRTYFIGYPIDLEDLDDKKFPLVVHEDGRLQLVSSLGVIEYDVEEYKKKISPYTTRIWVTPGLPFLIPITLGFIIAYFYGDLLFQLFFYLF